MQGTAAEWSLAWMADLRRRLDGLGEVDESAGAPRSGAAFARSPHLAFFLHDEVMVHTPAEHAGDVEEAVREAARAAGRLLFGDFPVDFPLDVAVVESYDQAG